MVDDRNKANRVGGPYMIQDRDHLNEAGQMGGDARTARSRQPEQSQGDSRQQGGERRQKKTKFL